MASADLWIIFRVWGVDVDPEALTAETGITPSRSFHVGEARGAYAKTVAGWEWKSASGEEPGPLLAEMFEVLSSHAEAFARRALAGADISAKLVGYFFGEVIASAARADELNYFVDESRSFRPFFDSPRFELFLDPEVSQFLASAGALFATHVDVCLEGELDN